MRLTEQQRVYITDSLRQSAKADGERALALEKESDAIRARGQQLRMYVDLGAQFLKQSREKVALAEQIEEAGSVEVQS
jgi:hypothetical protein